MNEHENPKLHTSHKPKKFIMAAMQIFMILIISALVLFIVLKLSHV